MKHRLPSLVLYQHVVLVRGDADSYSEDDVRLYLWNDGSTKDRLPTDGIIVFKAAVGFTDEK